MPIPTIAFSETKVRDLGFIRLGIGETYPDQYFVRTSDEREFRPSREMRRNFLTKYPSYRLDSFRLKEE